MDIIIEGKNKKYAELLKRCYISKFGDLTSFLLYKFESSLYSETDTYFSNNINKLSNDSLSHIEILGRLITLLGGVPDHIDFKTYDIFYIKDKYKLIDINIRLTKEKIILYTKCLNEIDDNNIKKILTNFIVEERKNLEILEIIRSKYKKERNLH